MTAASVTVSFTPRPGAAPLRRMVAAQAGMELRGTLRNGEQLLISLVIPILVLVAFSTVDLVEVGSGSRIDVVAPGVLALAVLSTAFTGQAIGTGFERKYGVLKRIGATPLSRFGLLAAKTVSVLAIEVIQVAVLVAVAAGLGWRPHLAAAAVASAVLLLLLGTAAFSALGLLLAGTLRAEATLATANLIYVILLGIGGVIFPLTRFPDAARPVLDLLPIAALTGGLRDTLQHGTAFPGGPALVLVVWAVVALAVAAKTFTWE